MSAPEHEGGTARWRPKSASERRRSSDARRLAAGQVRLNAWLSADRLAELDALMQTWGFSDRTQAIDVAVRYLAQQTRMQSSTLVRLDFA